MGAFIQLVNTRDIISVIIVFWGLRIWEIWQKVYFEIYVNSNGDYVPVLWGIRT